MAFITATASRDAWINSFPGIDEITFRNKAKNYKAETKDTVTQTNTPNASKSTDVNNVSPSLSNIKSRKAHYIDEIFKAVRTNTGKLREPKLIYPIGLANEFFNISDITESTNIIREQIHNMEELLGYKIVTMNDKEWHIILWNCEFNGKTTLQSLNQQLEHKLQAGKNKTANQNHKFVPLLQQRDWLKRFFTVLGQKPKRDQFTMTLASSRHVKEMDAN